MTTISPSSPASSPSGGQPLRQPIDLWPTQPLPAIAMPSPRRISDAAPAAHARRQHAAPGYLLLALLLGFALVNCADLASTYLGLSRGLSEGNPLMGALLTHFGFSALIAYKVIVISAVTMGALLLYVIDRRIAYLTALICTVLVLVVVVSNILQYVLVR